jgi:carbon-monoxide dehydrogenase medium subunit
VFARPGLPSFEYIRPATRDEVVDLLEQHGDKAMLLMGGTDLFPGLRDGLFHPIAVVDVKHLPGMRHIEYDVDTGLSIGAAVTMNELAHHPEVVSHYPLLSQAAGSVASYQIRNRATLGGNLCNASPCADTAPAVLVLEGQLVISSAVGERVVPASQFFRGPGHTALKPGEFLTAVRFPPPATKSAARYLKLGRCRSGDLSLVGVAIMGFHDPVSAAYRFRIGLGSVAPTPLRVPRAEEVLAASRLSESVLAQAAQQAMDASSPITDVRGTASYQRAMVRTLTLRVLRDICAQLQEE